MQFSAHSGCHWQQREPDGAPALQLRLLRICASPRLPTLSLLHEASQHDDGGYGRRRYAVPDGVRALRYRLLPRREEEVLGREEVARPTDVAGAHEPLRQYCVHPQIVDAHPLCTFSQSSLYISDVFVGFRLTNAHVYLKLDCLQY